MQNIILVIISIVLVLASTLANGADPICSLPHAKNGDGKVACLAYIHSWTYNSQTKSCVPFVYGGCGGNKNRFASRRQCENKCVNKTGRGLPRSKSI